MIVAHIARKDLESHKISAQNQALLKDAVWIDLLSPSMEEEKLVEDMLGLDVPTKEEMAQLELSSRLYKNNGAIFMTASVISQSNTPAPRLDPVSFVLTEQQLITVRYADPKTFAIFAEQFKTIDPSQRKSSILFVDLLQAHINRLADILELIGQHLNAYSSAVFAIGRNKRKNSNYSSFMQQIGFNGDLCTKVSDSLSTFDRMMSFLQQAAGDRLDPTSVETLAMLEQDIPGLTTHAKILSQKITFLLEATLGMINIEQNKIIKLFTVLGVIFLPPTLIASIYGMNFKAMPELSWKFGYEFAVLLMLLAAWLPYKIFKKNGWL
ncbi:MAG TPA: magnesium transporter CorA family protein [Gammaproteobacteria bacterium]|nr:magnesium transporter CorA family protein [Gammaproteobacteria bacterium]